MNNEEKNIQAEQPEEVKKSTFADWWKKLATGAKAGIISALSLIVIVPIVLVIALGGNGDNGGNGDGGNGGDGDKSIVVTVVDEDGNAIEGVELRFIKATTPLPKTTTDANGKATTTNKDVTKVKITKIPRGFTYSKLEEEQDIPTDGKLTITLEKYPEWVIKVVDQDDNGVEGVEVTMCVAEGDNAVCMTPIITDENGCAVYSAAPGEYKAKINSPVDGYDGTVVGEYYYFDGYEAIITITKIAE